MLYQRSLEIEQRLEKVLCLIRGGQHSTPDLAREIGVSIPTVSRYIAALRQRGHEIWSTREGSSWQYACNDEVASKSAKTPRRKPR